MLKSIEAVLEIDGRITLKEHIQFDRRRRAIVTILDEIETGDIGRLSEVTLLSESALKVDWDREEEDEAWSHLQQEQ